MLPLIIGDDEDSKVKVINSRANIISSHDNDVISMHTDTRTKM